MVLRQDSIHPIIPYRWEMMALQFDIFVNKG